jgi:predicted adenylyl cyclase CyaB
MPRNVEIKARLTDFAATRALVAAAADRGPESLAQTDTFFAVPSGRLKLREVSDRPAELIFYRRPDTPGPSESQWAKATMPDADALRELLAGALGVRGQVVKRRTLFFVGRTRVHLDEVRDLGDFLELEVVLNEGEDPREGIAEAHRLLRRFGIPDDALVPEAYVDLLVAPRGMPGRR